MILQFTKTFAFHYCVKDGTLYIKYGKASYYYDRVLAIDFGHGGEDVGAATADGAYWEKNVINAIQEGLIADYLDQTETMVYFTRTGDDTVSLKKRAYLPNDVGAGIYVSLHCNYYPYGSNAYGVEVMYNQKDKSKPYNSKWLAEKFSKSYPDALGQSNRGLIKADYLAVLKHAEMPACLLEMGFISNPYDIGIMTTPKKQKIMIKQIESILDDALDDVYRDSEGSGDASSDAVKNIDADTDSVASDDSK